MVNDLERYKAKEELGKKKARGIRESVKEDKVIAALRAADAAKKACDNMNSTELYKNYGVQDKPQSVSQPVSQSVSQKREILQLKGARMTEVDLILPAHPTTTMHIYKGHTVESPQGTKASYPIQLPISLVDW